MRTSIFTTSTTDKHPEYALIEIVCETPQNKEVSIIIALNKADIPKEGAIDLKKHESDILVRKFGKLTEEDRQNALELFKKLYCKDDNQNNFSSKA